MERAIVNTQYTENVTMSRLIEVASKQHGESNVASNRTVHVALRVSFQDCIGSAMATGQKNQQERQVEIKPLITATFEERQQTNRVHLVHRGIISTRLLIQYARDPPFPRTGLLPARGSRRARKERTSGYLSAMSLAEVKLGEC